MARTVHRAKIVDIFFIERIVICVEKRAENAEVFLAFRKFQTCFIDDF